MDKAAIIKVFVIAVLCFYLFKGVLALLMNQALIRMEKKGKAIEAKNKKAMEEYRKTRGW
ncbi:MAG: hypothetical protein Q4B48_00460 [Syntrophomonadaceae bacterium]|nr:hypothetical protein [Syntrophomonadaceae bacterium]